MVVGQLEIQMMASVARLQTDMDNAKRLVSDSVAKMTQILGAIGIGISVAGFNGLIRSVVDLGDKFNDLRKITGLTADQLAGLEKVALLNGSSLDQVSKAVGIMSKNIVAGSDALDLLGISSKQANGEFRSSLDVLLDVSDRFSQMRDGVQKAALAQEIFGKSGRELIPLLNEGRAALQSQIESYGLASGVTNQLAEDSDQFNDTLTILGSRVDSIKTSFVAELLPTLNAIGAAMISTGQSTNQFSFAASVVVPVLKGLAIAGFTIIDTFRGMGREIGARAAQLVAFSNLDFSGAKFIGTALAEDNKKARIEYDKFVDTILNGDKTVQNFTDTQKEYLKIEQQIPGAIDKTSRATEKKNKEFNMQLYLLKQYDDEARRARDITQSVATEQEIYNQKLEELNNLKPYLTIETYDRALAKLSDTNKKVEVSTRQTTDEVSQLWIQTGRNIQSTLANSIFNFFDDGLKGMLKNVISTVGRIASEFAALKLAQNSGLSQMFSSGGIGGTGSVGAGASNALSLASIGSSLSGGLKSGFGLNGLVGGGLSSIGGSSGLGSFGAGLQGGRAGASFIAAESAAAGAGAFAGAGAALGAAAGPLMIAAAGTALLRSLAGDKRLGGGFGKALNTIGDIPILGDFIPVVPLMNFLFGRGPYKFRQQVATGEANAEGFEGSVTDIFKSKGGLFVKNKHKEFDSKNSTELLDLFSTTIKGYADASRGFAANLGLDTNVINNYSKTIRLESEKGKTLTEEAIRDMMSGIGNEIAQGLLPTVDTFKKAGEDSMATLSRLNTEFVSLQQGAINLGASAEYAKQLVSGLGIATRTAYVDAAGGPEVLLELTAKFNANFLTEAERMAVPIKLVEDGLTSLGFSADITREQFGDLIQSLTLAGDATAILLLQNQDLFLSVDSYKQSLKPVREAPVIDESAILQQRLGLETQLLQLQGNTVELRKRELEAIDPANRALQQRIFYLQDEQRFSAQAKQALSDAFSSLQRSVESQRKKVTDAYNQDLLVVTTSIQKVTDSISKLKSLSSALGSTVDALRPLSRDDAKYQILSAINKAKLGGGLPETADISKALDVLKSNNITGVRSSFEQAREQAKTAILVDDLNDLTNSQLSVEERSLIQLQNQKRILDEGFKNEMTRLDGLLAQAQAQIDAMNNLNTSVISLTEAIANFNLASTQGGGGAIGGGEIASGNLDYSNKDIIDYFKTEHSARQIYIDAVSRGISSAQIVNSGAVTQAQADQYFKDNPKIPHFANGGYHKGGLRIVGERGPELERTGASNITSNKDIKNATGNDQIITLLTEMKKDISGLAHGQFTLKTKTA